MYLHSKIRQIRWEKDKEKQFLLLMKGQRYKYYFYMEFLDGGKWKKHFPVLFSGNMAQLINFMGLLIIPIQIRGEEFPEKPKLLYSGTCTSTSTRHVNLKSPLLLQFPYCELCDNDNKQSNCRLMNVLVLYKCPISWF